MYLSFVKWQKVLTAVEKLLVREPTIVSYDTISYRSQRWVGLIKVLNIFSCINPVLVEGSQSQKTSHEGKQVRYHPWMKGVTIIWCVI